MKKNSILLLIFILAFYTSFSQLADYRTAKEKIYVQTSHVFFKPSETVYFKIYLVQGKDQKPSRLSSVVYAELMNPAGNVLQKVNLTVENGYAEGSFDLPRELPGGLYKLRAYTNWMRNEKESLYFMKELTIQQVIAPRVLMKLDFPKKGYSGGDEVLAEYSMRSLDDKPIRNYRGKFTVSVAGKKVETTLFKTNSDGKAAIKFFLPRDLSSKDGLLNVTIEYDGYTESISRSIPIVLHKIDLQFMPEGGNLIEGLPNTVAFKAVNDDGKPSDIKGQLQEVDGTTVLPLESFHSGMGRFSFTPLAGKKYKVVLSNPSNIRDEFFLPEAKQEGISIQTFREGNKIRLVLYAKKAGRILLKGETKSQLYYSKEMGLNKGENELVIDAAIFPMGITQFTFYSQEGLPLAERLLFLNQNQQLKISVTTNRKKYLPREQVNLTIKTTDENGKPLPSNLSMAVIDDKLWSFADDKQDHILSWLLMGSELRGKIEEPQFYFRKEEAKAEAALDLLMLTQGYRYFDFIADIKEKGVLKFAPQQANTLSGVIVNENEKPVQANVYLVNTVYGGNAIQFRTAADGAFYFSDLIPNTDYHVFAQPLDKKSKVSIQNIRQGEGFNPLAAKTIQDSINKDKFFIQAEAVEAVKNEENDGKANKKMKADIAFMRQQNNLQEVVVIGFGMERRMNMAGAVAVVQQKDLVAANNLGGVLQGKVPGVMVVPGANPQGEAKISIRGTANTGEQPLIVLNGVPMEGTGIHLIKSTDVESVTILKDASATSLYGARAANGVILIESKKGRNERIRLDFSNAYHYATRHIRIEGPAFAVARKFYAPKYSSTRTSERTDFRETIYWNGVIQTDRNGEARISFYNSDATTTMRIIAEGIGFNGKPGRIETTYAVQNEFSVDAKFPPYLTVGDKPLIPLVIKNNSEDEAALEISLELPKGLRAEGFENKIKLEAGAARQILIPMEAVSPLEGNLKFLIRSEHVSETLVLPVSAVQKGFAIIKTLSGNSSSTQSFQINHLIPGSLTASIRVFRSLEGQLLDGIESMLREPYGCFEQTSSATYPNIYVLKYLKHSGKSNPAIERKAMEYIRSGYKRLTGYETEENGFEWFGKTPPHEALTAYGLLEFTDMQEFIPVDKAMLERTKTFLLSRRDGKGGFKLNKRGYDQFAAVPDRIASMYIVYSLTQAGIGKEVRAEYEAALQKALESKDCYQLSMMALAAHNMKDAKAYFQLMDRAKKLFREKGCVSETSVVNSREASLRVETISLYALALLRDPGADLAEVAGLLSKIMSEKTYYGYGATQATVLALQAIVEYSKRIGNILDNSEIDFTVNKQKIGEGTQAEKWIRDGDNTFQVAYNNEKNAVPYNMELAYYTFTPPNSEKAELDIKTVLSETETKVGETTRMQISVTNKKSMLQPMAIAKIGIPAGLSIQPWQLKELTERNRIAYYEIFDHYLVFYWMGFAPNEMKTIELDLKADIAGVYKGKASNTCLYYTPEHKNWAEGIEVTIKQ